LGKKKKRERERAKFKKEIGNARRPRHGDDLLSGGISINFFNRSKLSPISEISKRKKALFPTYLVPGIKVRCN